MIESSAMPFLIPITVLIGAFAIGIVAMILRSHAKERQHRERMFMAEKGLDIPKELYDIPAPRPEARPNGYRAGRAWLMILGALCIFIGIGVMVSLGVRHGMYEGIQGLIPLMIGIGFLASERLIAKIVVKTGKQKE
jgi:hypothetical protein